VRLESGHVEADDAREGVTLDQLLRRRAELSLAVEDDLALVDVDAQNRHEALPRFEWTGAVGEPEG